MMISPLQAQVNNLRKGIYVSNIAVSLLRRGFYRAAKETFADAMQIVVGYVSLYRREQLQIQPHEPIGYHPLVSISEQSSLDFDQLLQNASVRLAQSFIISSDQHKQASNSSMMCVDLETVVPSAHVTTLVSTNHQPVLLELEEETDDDNDTESVWKDMELNMIVLLYNNSILFRTLASLMTAPRQQPSYCNYDPDILMLKHAEFRFLQMSNELWCSMANIVTQGGQYIREKDYFVASYILVAMIHVAVELKMDTTEYLAIYNEITERFMSFKMFGTLVLAGAA